MNLILFVTNVQKKNVIDLLRKFININTMVKLKMKPNKLAVQNMATKNNGFKKASFLFHAIKQTRLLKHICNKNVLIIVKIKAS